MRSELTSSAGYSRADTHMHTNLGDGWASPAQVIKVALNRGLRLIAITDHDHVEGAKRVADLLARQELPLQMITGVEVSTRQGHLLGLFIQKAPRSLRSVEESIDAIKEQGGLVIVPHPFGRLVPSLSRAKIDELLKNGFPIDGIEIYNPSPANASMRLAVRTRQPAVGPGRNRRQRRALLAAHRRRLHALPRKHPRRPAPLHPRTHRASRRPGTAARAPLARRLRRPGGLELVRRSPTQGHALREGKDIDQSSHTGENTTHCSG